MFEFKIEYKDVIIKGWILDYCLGFVSKIVLIIFDLVKGVYESEEVKINNDGIFVMRVKVLIIILVVICFFGKMIIFYVVLGEESSVIINICEFCC